jgi:hypothetical protein
MEITVKRALKDIHIINRLDIASNGEEALEFLKNVLNQKPVKTYYCKRYDENDKRNS